LSWQKRENVQIPLCLQNETVFWELNNNNPNQRAKRFLAQSVHLQKRSFLSPKWQASQAEKPSLAKQVVATLPAERNSQFQQEQTNMATTHFARSIQQSGQEKKSITSEDTLI